MHVFYFMLLWLSFFNEEMNSFYLPAEYRIKRQTRIKRARDYLEQFGYFEKDIPPCTTKLLKSDSYCVIPNPYNGNVTEEEALKKFQKFTGLKQTGIIDDETIKKMEEPRCGNSDAQNHIKTIEPPWKRTYLTYAFLNFPNNNETEEMRKALNAPFLLWQMFTPIKFYETRIIEKADIKIQFAKGEHGCVDKGVPRVFDGVPGGVFAHGFPDGRLHFDGDENWRVYENGETPILEQTDLMWVALHEIGHVLGLNHSHIVDSIMARTYSSPEKRSTTGYYSYPKITKDDIKTIQNIYGRKVAKAAKNGLKPQKECDKFCFI